MTVIVTLKQLSRGEDLDYFKEAVGRDFELEKHREEEEKPVEIIGTSLAIICSPLQILMMGP